MDSSTPVTDATMGMIPTTINQICFLEVMSMNHLHRLLLHRIDCIASTLGNKGKLDQQPEKDISVRFRPVMQLSYRILGWMTGQ
jgi:hypothetical protein